MHRDVVLPALDLLADQRFAGANDEYRLAHRAYMEGRNSECLVNCGKAFESAMKVTLTLAGHAFDAQRDTAAILVGHLKTAGVLQPEVVVQFPALISCLKEGIPPVRNRLGGHGAGATPYEVPDHVAAYLLHLTGANILLLVGGSSTGR